VPGHCQSNNPRPNSSTADPTLSTISHEQIETVTDPLSDSWIDGMGNEIADLCITNFGRAVGGAGGHAFNEVIHGGHYYLQEVWSNDTGSCQPRATPDRISFKTGGAPQQGTPAVFTANGRDPDGRIVGWSWFLGDGDTKRGRRVSHVYARPGVYRVVLRSTDSAGNYAFYADVIRVRAAGHRVRR
jgi:hypothetical protein